MDPEAERRCREKLQSVKLWGENLASFEHEDVGAIARQLVDELGLPFYDEVVDWVTQCIGEAKMEATMSARASGLYIVRPGLEVEGRATQDSRAHDLGTGDSLCRPGLACEGRAETQAQAGAGFL